MDTNTDWTIAGCPVCGWTAHQAPQSTPVRRCPKDGEKLILLDGSVGSWERLAAAHRLVRHAIRDARRLAHA